MGYWSPEKRKQYYERTRNRDRSKAYQKRYGITLDDYERLYEIQRGRCILCGRTSAQALDVDHDHLTGLVRGLLCRQCNVALGLFQHNPVTLQHAAWYLKPVWGEP